MKFTYSILISLIQFSFGLNSYLIKDFLKNYKDVQSAVIFTCSYIPSLAKLGQDLSESDIYFKFHLINPKDVLEDLPKILNRKIVAKSGVVVDTNCDGYENVLLQASNFNYFNLTYHWLIIDEEAIGEGEIFHPKLKAIGINSQITYAKKADFQYQLIDVYSKALQLGFPIIFESFGSWNNQTGFNITKNLQPMYSSENRGNFDGITLRGSVVIDKDNIFPEDVDGLLVPPEPDQGISMFTKYHYSLNKYLMNIYNFS